MLWICRSQELFGLAAGGGHAGLIPALLLGKQTALNLVFKPQMLH